MYYALYYGLAWLIAFAGFLLTIGNNCSLFTAFGIMILVGSGFSLVGAVVTIVAKMETR